MPNRACRPSSCGARNPIDTVQGLASCVVRKHSNVPTVGLERIVVRQETLQRPTWGCYSENPMRERIVRSVFGDGASVPTVGLLLGESDARAYRAQRVR